MASLFSFLMRRSLGAWWRWVTFAFRWSMSYSCACADMVTSPSGDLKVGVFLSPLLALPLNFEKAKVRYRLGDRAIFTSLKKPPFFAWPAVWHVTRNHSGLSLWLTVLLFTEQLHRAEVHQKPCQPSLGELEPCELQQGLILHCLLCQRDGISLTILQEMSS